MLVALAATLSACGGGDQAVTIPQANANQLLGALDRVETACSAQLRSDAVSAANDFIAGVNALPKEVGTDTKDAMRDAGTNLKTLAASCKPSSDTTDEATTTTSSSESTTTEPTSTTATTTTDTTSTETETTTTSTSTDTTTTSEPPPPGGGNGGGSGGVGGGGG
jgi:hypothetical protein